MGPAEISAAMYMLAFSLPLFIIQNLSEYRTYGQMAKMAPGWVWGLVLGCVGLCRIGTVIHGSFNLRVVTTAAAISSWCLLFLSYLLARQWHPGATVFATWTVLEMWTLYRIKRGCCLTTYC